MDQFRSKREYIFKFLVIVFIAVLAGYIYFLASNYIVNQKIKNNQETLNKQNVDLEKYKQST
jgi:cell division protein FtsL